MFLYYTLITILIVILFALYEDKTKLLNNLGIASIVAGILLLVIGCIFKALITVLLNNFNMKKLSSLVFNKFSYISIITIIIGLIGVITSIILKNIRKIRIH